MLKRNKIFFVKTRKHVYLKYLNIINFNDFRKNFKNFINLNFKKKINKLKFLLRVFIFYFYRKFSLNKIII